MLLSVLFFFSSRRRHTRSKRDWSSDVCSSDLALRQRAPRLHEARLARAREDRRAGGGARSEERRVGKECRSRGSPYHYKKKKWTRMIRRCSKMIWSNYMARGQLATPT